MVVVGGILVMLMFVGLMVWVLMVRDGMAEDGIGKEGDLNVDVDGDDPDASWWKWVAGGWLFSFLSFSDFLTSASLLAEPWFGGC